METDDLLFGSSSSSHSGQSYEMDVSEDKSGKDEKKSSSSSSGKASEKKRQTTPSSSSSSNSNSSRSPMNLDNDKFERQSALDKMRQENRSSSSSSSNSGRLDGNADTKHWNFRFLPSSSLRKRKDLTAAGTPDMSAERLHDEQLPPTSKKQKKEEEMQANRENDSPPNPTAKDSTLNEFIEADSQTNGFSTETFVF
jgi:hypothetical protein